MPIYIFLLLFLAGSLGAADLKELLQSYDAGSPLQREIELNARMSASEGRLESSLDSPALELEQGSVTAPGSDRLDITRIGFTASVRMPHTAPAAFRIDAANTGRSKALARARHHDARLRIALAYHRACLSQFRLHFQEKMMEQEKGIHAKISRGIKAGAYAEYERLLADMELAKQTMAYQNAEQNLLQARTELKNSLLLDIDVDNLACTDLAPVTLPASRSEQADPQSVLLEAEKRFRQEQDNLAGAFSHFELGAGQEEEGDETRTTIALSIPLGFFGAASHEGELARLKTLQAREELARYTSERRLYLHNLAAQLALSAKTLNNLNQTVIPAAKAYADLMARRYELGAGTLQELYRARAETTRITLEELENREAFYELLFEHYRYTSDIDYSPFRSQR